MKKEKDYPWPRPLRCPRCQGQRLWGHGYVQRYFEGFIQGLWMKRYRCPDCGAVHTSRLRGFYRGFHYSRFSILRSLGNRIGQGQWMRGVSRQVQQYWWKGFCKQASRFQNVKLPDHLSLRRLLGEGLIPVTHSFKREILRL